MGPARGTCSCRYRRSPSAVASNIIWSLPSLRLLDRRAGGFADMQVVEHPAMVARDKLLLGPGQRLVPPAGRRSAPRFSGSRTDYCIGNAIAILVTPCLRIRRLERRGDDCGRRKSARGDEGRQENPAAHRSLHSARIAFQVEKTQSAWCRCSTLSNFGFRRTSGSRICSEGRPGAEQTDRALSRWSARAAGPSTGPVLSSALRFTPTETVQRRRPAMSAPRAGAAWLPQRLRTNSARRTRPLMVSWRQSIS